MATTNQPIGIVCPVLMGEWQSTALYEKLNIVRYNGASYMAKKQNQNFQPTVTSGWQAVWQVVAYDGGGVEPTGTYPDMTVGNATNAQNDGSGKNIAEQFENINEKIPSTASVENQLADKAFVNSSINNSAAFYITYNTQGEAFPTREALLKTTIFYSGGKERVPTQNDYATVLADDSQPVGANGSYPTTRYTYQTDTQNGKYPDGQWDFQYVVNNTSLTQAQLDAINSGITNDLVGKISTPSITIPLMDGTANVGTSESYARGDHRHPTDTTRASTAVATQTSNGLMSAADKTKLDGLGTSNVTGVKGSAETSYRTGNVNLTPANIGAVPEDSETIAVGDSAQSYYLGVSMGRNAKAGDISVAIGVNADGAYTHYYEYEDGEKEYRGTAVGAESEAGPSAVALGYSAVAYGLGSVALGEFARVNESDRYVIQLGSTSTSALRCKVSLKVTSDERDKTDISVIDSSKALNAIELIEPIQYVDNDRANYLLRETKINENKTVIDEFGKNNKFYKKYGMCDYDKESHARGEKKGTRGRVGVKAQQVAKVLKEVFGSDNYANIVDDNFYDLKAKGEKPPVENKLMVAYDRFVPLLIGAIQEQQKQIKELKKQINRLEKL